MVTPGSRYREEHVAILAKRKETIRKTKQKLPSRWISDRILNCEPIGGVWLNPENGQVEESKAVSGHA